MEGWYPKVRLGKRRVRVPVLVTLGVRADGQRVVLDVRLAGDESTAAWRDVIQSVVERQVGRPLLAIIDGSAGLAAALREQWPTLTIQRCTAHNLRNLEGKAPVRLREELAEDYRRMIYAETRTLVDQARTRFARSGDCDVRRWSSASRKRATSLQDTGEPARPGGRLAAALWFAAERPREAPEDRRLGGDGTHREGRVINGSAPANDALPLFHQLTDTAESASANELVSCSPVALSKFSIATPGGRPKVRSDVENTRPVRTLRA